MTQVLSPSDEDVKDFSRRVDVKFRIDDDVFYGVAGIPALDLLEFGALYQGLSEEQLTAQPDTFKRIFQLTLDDRSAELFIGRMKSREKPISMEQVMDIMPWMMEKYGMRPTQPSSSSSTGSENPDDGTSSTVSAQQLELTSAP
jgi:hypothetical protein